MPKTTTKTPDDDDRCPNCGYCHHCGQSAKPKVIERIVERNRPILNRPLDRPYMQPWEGGERFTPYVTWSSGTSTEISKREGHQC